MQVGERASLTDLCVIEASSSMSEVGDASEAVMLAGVMPVLVEDWPFGW